MSKKNTTTATNEVVENDVIDTVETVNETPVDEVSTPETPTEAPVDEIPTEEPVDEDEVSTPETTTEAPVDEAPVPEPADEEPVDESPVDEKPEVDTDVEPVDEDEVSTPESPTETPVDENPVDETPTPEAETPVEETEEECHMRESQEFMAKRYTVRHFPDIVSKRFAMTKTWTMFEIYQNFLHHRQSYCGLTNFEDLNYIRNFFHSKPVYYLGVEVGPITMNQFLNKLSDHTEYAVARWYSIK